MHRNIATPEEILKITNELVEYCNQYYNGANPAVSDQVYDAKYRMLQEMEEETGIVYPFSPTQNVGYKPVNNLPKVAHEIKLLSLENIKTVEEAYNFIGQQPVLLMYKLDGLTLKLVYENGELIQASTRGNGAEGEDVTHNAVAFQNIPLKIPYKEQLVITGEAFISDDDFKKLSEQSASENSDGYTSSRALASGSIRLKDPEECKKRRLNFYAFRVLSGFEEKELKSLKLTELKNMGFEVCPYLIFKNLRSCGDKFYEDYDKSSIQFGINNLQNNAKLDKVPIDGIVITYNNTSYSEEMGTTGKYYKDGIAFKFDDEFFETEVISIEFSMGRSGVMTPVATFEPVNIDGSIIQRATVHNLARLMELNLAPGDRVLISKRFTVIPHIEQNLNQYKEEKAIYPKTCPFCGEETHLVKQANNKGDALYCLNKECPERLLQKFVHYVSEKAMNISGLSSAKLSLLIHNDLLKTISDLYSLKEHYLIIKDLPGFGEKSASNLIAAIEDSRNTTFERFLISMDIPNVGNHVSDRLKAVFGSIDDFFRHWAEGGDLRFINGLGEGVIRNIEDWFDKPENVEFWQEMFSIMTFESKLKDNDQEEITMRDTAIKGKNIVVTGTLQGYTRSEIQSLISRNGGIPADRVTKSTDLVVFGEKAGSKLEKAKKLNIETMSEAEFLVLIKE